MGIGTSSKYDVVRGDIRLPPLTAPSQPLRPNLRQRPSLWRVKILSPTPLSTDEDLHGVELGHALSQISGSHVTSASPI